MFYQEIFVLIFYLFLVGVAVVRTLWWFRHGRAQTVHVVASVTIIAEQQLVLEQRRTLKSTDVIMRGHILTQQHLFEQ